MERQPHKVTLGPVSFVLDCTPAEVETARALYDSVEPVAPALRPTLRVFGPPGTGKADHLPSRIHEAILGRDDR